MAEPVEAFGMSCLRPSFELRAETTYSWILCRHHPLPHSGLRALPTTLPWLLDPELQLFLRGMGHSIHAGSFLHQHGAWSLVDPCEGSELYLRWTSSLRESQAGKGGRQGVPVVPESREPPTTAGETREHGAVETLPWPPETDTRSKGGRREDGRGKKGGLRSRGDLRVGGVGKWSLESWRATLSW